MREEDPGHYQLSQIMNNHCIIPSALLTLKQRVL